MTAACWCGSCQLGMCALVLADVQGTEAVGQFLTAVKMVATHRKIVTLNACLNWRARVQMEGMLADAQQLLVDERFGE